MKLQALAEYAAEGRTWGALWSMGPHSEISQMEIDLLYIFRVPYRQSLCRLSPDELCLYILFVIEASR